MSLSGVVIWNLTQISSLPLWAGEITVGDAGLRALTGEKSPDNAYQLKPSLFLLDSTIEGLRVYKDRGYRWSTYARWCPSDDACAERPPRGVKSAYWRCGSPTMGPAPPKDGCYTATLPFCRGLNCTIVNETRCEGFDVVDFEFLHDEGRTPKLRPVKYVAAQSVTDLVLPPQIRGVFGISGYGCRTNEFRALRAELEATRTVFSLASSKPFVGFIPDQTDIHSWLRKTLRPPHGVSLITTAGDLFSLPQLKGLPAFPLYDVAVNNVPILGAASSYWWAIVDLGQPCLRLPPVLLYRVLQHLPVESCPASFFPATMSESRHWDTMPSNYSGRYPGLCKLRSRSDARYHLPDAPAGIPISELVFHFRLTEAPGAPLVTGSARWQNPDPEMQDQLTPESFRLPIWFSDLVLEDDESLCLTPSRVPDLLDSAWLRTPMEPPILLGQLALKHMHIVTFVNESVGVLPASTVDLRRLTVIPKLRCPPGEIPVPESGFCQPINCTAFDVYSDLSGNQCTLGDSTWNTLTAVLVLWLLIVGSVRFGRRAALQKFVSPD